GAFGRAFRARPKNSQPLSPEKLSEVAALQVERVNELQPDGLVVYDIQDEAMRRDARPFPFVTTLDPVAYSRKYFTSIRFPKIYYRAVGKYSPDVIASDLANLAGDAAVFVGAPSRKQRGRTTLAEAYELRRKLNPDFVLGGVAIPERHLTGEDEHLRVVKKMADGCSFFITQCVYNVDVSKNFLSDYYYHCQNAELEMVPIIFTITPCGSLKTLDFMKWLGVSIPKWLENDLVNAGDILEASLESCKRTFSEILSFADEKRIPIGCNIESVASRKVEIEASLALGAEIRAMFDR
ncbi:MAG: methylenetetrahydrofolate reductase, partial [Burkholderiaceae bacterium]